MKCSDNYILRRNVKRFRGGLEFEAHRLCVSLNARLESNTEEKEEKKMIWLAVQLLPARPEGTHRPKSWCGGAACTLLILLYYSQALLHPHGREAVSRHRDDPSWLYLWSVVNRCPLIQPVNPSRSLVSTVGENRSNVRKELSGKRRSQTVLLAVPLSGCSFGLSGLISRQRSPGFTNPHAKTNSTVFRHQILHAGRRGASRNLGEDGCQACRPRHQAICRYSCQFKNNYFTEM